MHGLSNFPLRHPSEQAGLPAARASRIRGSPFGHAISLGHFAQTLSMSVRELHEALVSANKIERDPADPKLVRTMPNAGYILAVDGSAAATDLDDPPG